VCVYIYCHILQFLKYIIYLNFCFALFFINFYICGETNTIRYLVTNQTVFCIAGPTKKLSLKHSFCEAVFTYFYN
jgi:hypothetical protein